MKSNVRFVSAFDPRRRCERCGGQFWVGDVVRVREGSGRKRYFHERCFEKLYSFLEVENE